jgi:hypothetical protein
MSNSCMQFHHKTSEGAWSSEVSCEAAVAAISVASKAMQIMEQLKG